MLLANHTPVVRIRCASTSRALTLAATFAPCVLLLHLSPRRDFAALSQCELLAIIRLVTLSKVTFRHLNVLAHLSAILASPIPNTSASHCARRPSGSTRPAPLAGSPIRLPPLLPRTRPTLRPRPSSSTTASSLPAGGSTGQGCGRLS